MDEFTRELKECAAALHDGMGGHADYCARLMEEAADRINRMKSDYTTQGLALKAAKAMQQAETERADANEQDKRRIDFLDEWGGSWDSSGMSLYVRGVFYDNGGIRRAIDDAIATNHATIQPLSTKE